MCLSVQRISKKEKNNQTNNKNNKKSESFCAVNTTFA